MPNLRLPALDPATVAEKRGTGYPEPYRSRIGERAKRIASQLVKEIDALSGALEGDK